MIFVTLYVIGAIITYLAMDRASGDVRFGAIPPEMMQRAKLAGSIFWPIIVPIAIWKFFFGDID